MGARQDHTERARSNAAFAERLLNPSSGEPDPADVQWAITAAFYSAVHYVEAFLADSGLHSANHVDRYVLMNTTVLPREVKDAYKSLKDLSEQTRYYLATYSVEFARDTVMSKYLNRLRRYFDPEGG